MRIATLLATVLTLLASCGGSADPSALTKSGEKALGTQDFAAALSDFEQALAALGDDTSSPDYARAKLGEIEARASTDAARAKDDLLALSKAMPGSVDDRAFNRIAGRMGDAGKFGEAVELLGAAKAIYPSSAHLDKLGARLREEAESAGDSSALDALAGLGYMGE